MEEFGKLEERVVLVGVQTDDHEGACINCGSCYSGKNHSES